MRFEKRNAALLDVFNKEGGEKSENRLAIVIGLVGYIELPNGGFGGSVRIIQDGGLCTDDVVGLLELALHLAKEEREEKKAFRSHPRSDVN